MKRLLSLVNSVGGRNELPVDLATLETIECQLFDKVELKAKRSKRRLNDVITVKVSESIQN